MTRDEMARQREEWDRRGAAESSVINNTRKDRAIAAYKKTRHRTDDEVASFRRGYEAAEWDFEMVAMNMGHGAGR